MYRNRIAHPTQVDGVSGFVQRASIYAALFYIAHSIAVHWGGPQFFSMWYPAAGVRFAALWLWGPAWIGPMLVVEILVQFASGFVVTEQGLVAQLVSITRAPICYALAVFTVQRWVKINPSNPMLLALAVLFGPALASLAAGLWGWLHPELPPFASGEPLILIVTTFMIGDLLGVILIAPLLIWIYHRLSGTKSVLDRPSLRTRHYLEIAGVFTGGCILAIMFLAVDPSLSLMPIILCIAWIGTRFGRIAAWVTLACSASVILAWSMASHVVADRYEFHIGIAMAAIAAFLAGSFSDAQHFMRREIERRDRILFQAERLKSVKAMSLAVIHDASQPLTTLSMETQHLMEVLRTRPVDVAEAEETGALIQRKVQNLADLILRMRRFGGREGEDRTLCSLAAVMDDALALLQPDMRKSGAHIMLKRPTEDCFIYGYSVELTQAMYNLMHNAFLSAPHDGFAVDIRSNNGCAEVHIRNIAEPTAPKNHGFGVGFHIARSIIEAHDGYVTLEQQGAQFHTLIILPETLGQ
jgi:signal transduction histidine kinase